MATEAPRLRVRLRSYIVIPARLASTRLPRKLLLRETGKSVLQHTYESALGATRPLGICVAADHEELVADVRRFGGNVTLTDPNAASGTDRIAEVARSLTEVDIVVNVQGDEPDIAGQSIDLAVRLLEDHPEAGMATLATPIRTVDQLVDPSCVKVVFDSLGRALYFSRSPIPYGQLGFEKALHAQPPVFHQHIGLYAYRREFLLRLSEMPRAPLEEMENLEQLRALQAGHTILVGVVDEPTVGIDTEKDYRAFVRRALSC